MAIDFSKLNSPEARAAAKQRQEERERTEQAKIDLREAQYKIVRPHLETLNEQERGFIRGVQRNYFSLGIMNALSDAQAKWLEDIATRHGWKAA